MTKARDIANLVDANGDIVSSALDNVPPSNDASALTTGTIDNARISLDANEIPNLDTAKITTGTFDDARMPSTVLNSNVDLTNLSASNLTSGTVPIARLGTSGTKDATTFLRGDNTFAEAGGGDVVLLATTNITANTGSVTFDGNFSSTYKNYQIIASQVVLSSNVVLNWRARISSSDYTAYNYFEVFDNAQGESGESATNIDRSWGNNVARLCNKNFSSTANYSSDFILTIFNPLDTNSTKNFKAEYVINSAGFDKLVTGNAGFIISNNAALTGISFFPASGNIQKGNFKLYGIK